MTRAIDSAPHGLQFVKSSALDFRSRIIWGRVAFFCLFHVLALWAIFELSDLGFISVIVLHVLTGCFGISIGYHRMLSHRSFECPIWVKNTLALFGALAWQGGPLSWAASHRAHHRHTDHEGDPHSRSNGFLWSHFIWALVRAPNGYRYRAVSLQVPDLKVSAFLIFLEKNYLAINMAFIGLCMLLLGFQVTLAAIFLRVVVVWHCTWLVNSCCHRWNRIEGKGEPTNQRWVALLTYGEGMHLNHHQSPAAPVFAENPAFDWAGLILKLAQRAGLVIITPRKATS